MEDTPWEVEQIQEEIVKVKKMEKELKQNIPQKMHVSVFQVETNEISDYLCEKYYTLSKNLIDMIAKRARSHTQAIFNQFMQIQNKIREVPSDIEKLVEMKEYMELIPSELEKIKYDMTKCFDVYKILEGFNYRFSKDDLDRRWHIFGGVKDILELIEKRTKEVEKDKERFQDLMKEEQEELRDRIENLDQTITSFHSFKDLKMAEEVAQTAKDVNKCLSQFIEDSNKFNSREALFEMDGTNYEKIQQMMKEFQPYSNLWITADKWLKYKQ